MEERVRRMLREKSFAQKWGEIGDSTDLSGEKMDESVFERYLDSLQPWLIAYNRAFFLERAHKICWQGARFALSIFAGYFPPRHVSQYDCC